MAISQNATARRVHRFLLAIIGSFLLIAGVLSATAPRAEAASLREVVSFGSNPGQLQMFVYVPDSAPSTMPLVVVLHGCGQTASGYGVESGWTTMADIYGFGLVLPQQRSSNNPMSCFNWFEPGDIARDSGESLSIKRMIDKAGSSYSIDSARVYVTGLSGGAFMASNLLAGYPDVFAGGAIIAGGPARCATSSVSAFLCMNPGSNKTPRQWGDLARGAFSGANGQRPTVSIWHGGSDTVVNSMNLVESVEQWTNVHRTDQVADVQDTVNGYPHKVYRDAAGAPVVETYLLTNRPHGQPLDPGPGPEQCGTAGATAMVDMNVCGAYHISRFFGLTAVTTPPPGDTMSFTSGAEDGYVKAKSDGSAAQVGTNKSTLGLAVGRGFDGLSNRAVLSFDTSSIPDGAQVTRAYVTVSLNSAWGDPWAASNALMVDVQTGCLGADCAVGADDWAASSSAPGAATIAKWPTGSAESTDVGPAGRDAINRTGTTQVKLRFAQFPATTAYVVIGHGSNVELTVEYELP